MEVTLASALLTGLVEIAQVMLMNVHQFPAYTEHVTILRAVLNVLVKTDGQGSIAKQISMNVVNSRPANMVHLV